MDNPQLKAAARKLMDRIGDRAGIHEVEALFKEFDTDNSGEIDLNEFTQGLHEFGVELWAAEVEELFQLADLDGSGSISLPELVELIKGQLEVQMLEDQGKAVNVDVVKALHGGARFTRTESNAGNLKRQVDTADTDHND
jgi:hypothetical protein